ncbi:MAG: superoxide dismutase family protein [Oscillospiraceae bacterium]|nr:superoxide dismutase family protein [Oscillospiraceae bacterium]
MSELPSPLPQVLLENHPTAFALLQGDDAHPELRGELLFYPYQAGSLLAVRVVGLPHDGFFALHIHETGDCCTGGDLPFHCAGGHYNPTNTIHPEHAGDLPVLLSSSGCAYTIVYTGRFRPEQVLGHSVLIHGSPDDYHSQPAGNSGNRIACGVIQGFSAAV